MNWEKKTKELTDREKEILELIDKKKNETEALRKILESIEKKRDQKTK
ncbi:MULTISPECIES: hypothetical protein [Marinifilum]|nr:MULTISPECIES: hypothetical protein [Marinifilum]MDQ2178013.1 hypothetical protein [Marinifilum sp. D714]